MRVCWLAWLRWSMVLVLLSGLLSPSARAVQAADLADPRIFRALAPLSAPDAARLLRGMRQAGVPTKWKRGLYELVRMTEFGNSVPLELPTRTGRVCLAMGLRYDVNQVMELTPAKDEETRRAVADFLLTHESVHCASKVLPAPAAGSVPAGQKLPEIEGLSLLREEALADQVAGESMLTRGRAGYNAMIGWQRHRLYGFLRGDLDHWTTPLLRNGLDAVSESDYQTMVLVWPKLVKPLHRSQDGSAEQSDDWDSAFDQLPISLRAGLPTLNEIRALSQDLWPQSKNWLCAARIKRC